METTSSKPYAILEAPSISLYARFFFFFLHRQHYSGFDPSFLSPQGTVVLKNHDKPRTGRDIARVTFDLYKISPMDVFGSLSVKATFQGLYSVSADFQCLGPKKVLR